MDLRVNTMINSIFIVQNTLSSHTKYSLDKIQVTEANNQLLLVAKGVLNNETTMKRQYFIVIMTECESSGSN